MATILINGEEHTLPEGAALNAIQAAQLFGVDIPYYCWHPALSVVANCRMCEVEVGTRDAKTGEIRMVPKMVPGCQTPAKDGTVIVTNSEKVREHQRLIMEMLLINHPLDCPVCDQAGMCGLQDYSYEYGQSVHRFVETRNINPRKEVSDQIQLNQDRCIMCTRCVRFAREITQTNELQVMRRGDHAEIATFPGEPLDNPLAGNVVDICPVGALLDKDFLHKQRFWFTSKHETICTRCSSGCNTVSEENRGALWRTRARHNPEVNDFWICDEGRYTYKAANSPDLLTAMYVRTQDKLNVAPVDQAVNTVAQTLTRITREGGKVAAVISPFLTVEEAYLLAKYVKGLNAANVLALGPVPVVGEDQTFTPDPRKGRTGDTSFVVCRPFTIRAEKCPNRRGVEAVLAHFQGSVIDHATLADRVGKKEFKALYVTSDAIEPAFTAADAQKLRPGVDFLVVQDVWPTELAAAADVVLAGATFAEKAGCYVNAQGRLQYGKAALPPRDGSLPDLDLLCILCKRAGEGPVSSRDVLRDLAAEVSAFAGVASGKVPVFGQPLGAPADGQAEPHVYVEPWLITAKARGERFFVDAPAKS